jgi:hypothetical protein
LAHGSLESDYDDEVDSFIPGDEDFMHMDSKHI